VWGFWVLALDGPGGLGEQIADRRGGWFTAAALIALLAALLLALWREIESKRTEDEGGPVESPDLNTYLHIQMICLAQIADKLNMDSEAAMWRRRAASLVQRMIKDFWDPQAGVFWALKDEKPVKVVTPFNLLPLWTGSCPEITTPLLDHLKIGEFWSRTALPTVARNDPRYDPETHVARACEG
jgi:glycogen debranching enzyme